MKPKQVLLVIAHEGYQPIEYSVPKKILEEAGYTIVTASNKPGPAKATDDSETNVDITLDKVKMADYDGIFLIGGSGALENLDNQITYKLLKKAFDEHKIIGGICASARILAKAGILEGKQATGWDGDNQLSEVYKKHLVNYVREGVVVDPPFVTALGPAEAQKFGQNCVVLLQGQSSWG